MQSSLVDSGKKKDNPSSLTGTTLHVYRYLFKMGTPTGIREIQRGLNLSSTSVVEYHVKKLVSMGLVKSTENSQYFVDTIVFENMIRIRRSLIPIQMGYLAFFVTSFVILWFVLRPSTITNDYIFGLVIAAVGCGIFGYEAVSTIKRSSI